MKIIRVDIRRENNLIGFIVKPIRSSLFASIRIGDFEHILKRKTIPNSFHKDRNNVRIGITVISVITIRRLGAINSVKVFSF